jgi:hypothetical protein
MALGMLGVMASSARVQTIACVDEPVMGFFDADEDGVLTLAEVREADPDDPELQQIAESMEEEGLSGIQYRDCDAATPENEDGAGVSDTESGTVQQGDVANDDELTDGGMATETSNGGATEIVILLGIAGIVATIAVVALLSARQRRIT